jgi:hypothetical protein
MGSKPSGEPGWLRRWIFTALFMSFCAWRMVGLENAPDTRVNETLSWGYVIMMMVSFIGVTGFATAQDIAAIVATRSGFPYAAPATAPDETAKAGAPPKDFAG